MLEFLVGLLVLAPQDEDALRGISSMLKLSLVLDKVAEYLRNDSLEYIEEHDALYGNILDLLERLGKLANLKYLVTDERYGKSQSPGLLLLSLGVPVDWDTRSTNATLPSYNSRNGSILSIFENIYQQSVVVLRGVKEDPKLTNMCQRIQEVHGTLFEQFLYVDGSAPTLRPAQQWTEFHKANALTFSDSISSDFLPLLKTEAEKIADNLQNARTTHSRNRRILTECANMRTSLDEGTFVIVAESRPDCMRVLMVGPQGTAYADGLFE